MSEAKDEERSSQERSQEQAITEDFREGTIATRQGLKGAPLPIDPSAQLLCRA